MGSEVSTEYRWIYRTSQKYMGDGTAAHSELIPIPE